MAQSDWTEHGTLEHWTREGDHWQLNATGAGVASLVLLPQQVTSPTSGCSFRIRWRQEFSGSNANYTRLHWLFDSTAWFASPTPEIPVSGWSVGDTHGPLSFMHVGETGTDDSIHWVGPGPGETWDSVVSSLNHAHLPESFDIELTWSQQSGSDTARITIARVLEDESRPFLDFGADAAHGIPIGIGFSVQFTASNADAASIEILEYGPYVPDTLPPIIKQAHFRSGGGLLLAFSEPLNPHAGCLMGGDTQDSLPLTWLSPPSRMGVALPALLPSSNLHLHLSGFEDLNGQSMPDTSITVYPITPVAEQGDVVITEFMIESPTQGEWLELLNTTNQSLEINTLNIWDGSTHSTKALVPGLGWDGVLCPGQRALVANQWEPWMAEAAISSFATIHPPMTLSNTGETIGILSSEGHTIDEVAYRNDWWNNSSSIGLQKRHPRGCSLEQNWAAIGDDSESSPGLPSSLEWPLDTAIDLVAESAVALSPGMGVFELNQPLHPSCTPVVKGGWSWRHEQQPSALLWRIDSLKENSRWHVTAAGVRGCFNATPTALKATLEVAKFPKSGDLIFTEIAHNPKGISASWGMFVELLNPSASHVIELAGCCINGIALDAFPPLPPLGRICVPIPLGRSSGRIELLNHQGQIIDAVAYSRCWHPNREQSEAGFSLVRLQPRAGRVHPGGWWAWTSSADPSIGCSPGLTDLAESAVPSPPAASAIACGVRNGERMIAFAAPVQLEPPWIALDSFFREGMVWANPSGAFAPFEALCPASGVALDASEVGLNEVRKKVYGGAEPFIELANPGSDWASTENLFWSTEAIPFPDDWEPLSAETHWFIPPETTLALADCPSRIASNVRRIVPAELPSLWGSVELRLAYDGDVLDAFIFKSEMEAPWHTAQHSIEKTTRKARNADAHWTTAASASGNTAGSWNSWQVQPDLGLNVDILHVIQSTGFTSPNGEVVPISFQITAPDEEAWEVHWTIENNMGTLIASNGAFAPLVAGDHPIVCQWDGTHGRTYAALGPYLLNVQLHSVQSHRLFRAQAPVYVCPP